MTIFHGIRLKHKSIVVSAFYSWNIIKLILFLRLFTQDFSYLYDPTNETAGTFVPAQILYDAFHGRYNSSAGAIILLFIIWGSFFFGGLSITTSAARVVNRLFLFTPKTAFIPSLAENSTLILDLQK